MQESAYRDTNVQHLLFITHTITNHLFKEKKAIKE